MAYLGNQPVVGDSANTFKLLDDISTFTLTFDGSSTDVVSVANDTLTFANHRFITGQKVTYTDGGGTVITGLTDGTSYFIIKVDQNTIKLATNASNAASSTAIDLTGVGAGTSHTLNVAFDGVNTKFKATHTSGIKSKVSRAAQISLSINGVIQQPQDTSSPTVGYGVEPDSTIVFSTAPVATDKAFGTFIGEVAPSFDLTDNTVDNFTGDGSTTTFTLSRETPSSQDVLVTLDGVTQYPSDASTTRSYSVVNQGLTFVSAPDTGVAIQARHIGFAGATTSAVTGFYGRTGNVALKSTDDISVQNISGVGATFTGNLNIEGVLTYEDVTNVDSIGIITARAGVLVGSGITLSKDGDGFFTGVTTTGSLVSSGAISGTTGTFSGAISGTTGTFSGAISGTTGTFSDDVTLTGSNKKLITNSTSSGDYIRLYAAGGTGKWDIYGNGANLRFSDNESAGVVQFDTDITVADKIVHTGDTNTALRFPSADTITAETDGSERVRIASNGRVNIGDRTTTPDELVHIHTASGEANVHVEAATNANLNLRSHSGDSTIKFSDGSSTNVGNINYDHATDSLSFRTNSNERLRITSGGALNVPAGIGPQLRFENQHSVTADAAISTFDDSSGTMLVLGSNYYINSAGSENRYNTSEESAGVLINRNGDLNLKTGGTGATATTRLTINSSGNVGINKNSPQYILHVGGTENYPLINVEAGGATGGMGIGSGILRLYYGTTARLNITDSTGVVSASNFQTGGYFGSSGPGGGTGIKLQGLAAGSGTSIVDTGISVNRGNAGSTMLVLGSRNTGAGTATQGYAWLLKFQYDGNTLPTVYNITGSGSFWTISLTGSNTLGITGNAANWQFGGMWVD